MILGTAAYMAPEQAKGRPVDKRADIWAFGCVVYEMVTGRPAFDGDDVSDTLANILKAEPDWAALPPDTPQAAAAVAPTVSLEGPQRAALGHRCRATRNRGRVEPEPQATTAPITVAEGRRDTVAVARCDSCSSPV